MPDLFRDGCWIRHGAVVRDSTIDRGTFVGFRAEIDHAKVGRGVQIAARARLAGTGERPVRIGDGAWIGVGASIAPGVRIGEHAIVGAGSEVEHHVPPHTVCYGRPAVVRGRVETRFDDGDGIEGILALVRRRGPRDTSRLSADEPADPEAFFDCAAALGAGVTIGPAAVMIGRPDGPSPQGGITVGDRSALGGGLVAEGGGGLRIGVDAVLGAGVTITTSTHDHHVPGRPWTAAPVDIAAGVTIGTGAVIVGPVRLGAGASIAAGAVVTRSVAPGELSKGVFG